MGLPPSPALAARGISDFDVAAFHADVDARRVREGLSWAGLARTFNERIGRMPQIPPLSPGTLSGMTRRGGLNANIVMGVLRWIGRTPESYMPGHPDADALPPFPSGIVDPRWDARALHAAVDDRRGGRTWKGVAAEIGTVPSIIANTHKGHGIGFPGVMRTTVWLERPATDFVVEAPWNLV